MTHTAKTKIIAISQKILNVSFWDFPAMVAFLILMSVVFIQFMTRYVFNSSLGWTEEIARYFMILVGFLGGVSVARKAEHIYLQAVIHYLPPLGKKIAYILNEIISFCFVYLLIQTSQTLILKTQYQRMIALDFPKGWIFNVIQITLILYAVFSVLHLIVRLLQPSTHFTDSDLKEDHLI